MLPIAVSTYLSIRFHSFSYLSPLRDHDNNHQPPCITVYSGYDLSDYLMHHRR